MVFVNMEGKGSKIMIFVVLLTSPVCMYILYKRLIEVGEKRAIAFVWGVYLLFIVGHIVNDILRKQSFIYYHFTWLWIILHQLGLAFYLLDTRLEIRIRERNFTNTPFQNKTYRVIIIISIVECLLFVTLVK